MQVGNECPVVSRLAWVSAIGGNTEIYMLDFSNGEMVNISNDLEDDRQPIWSSDGNLAWLATRNNDVEIYVWNSLTGEIVNVSQNPAKRSDGTLALTNDREPAWSNDGRLAWASVREGNFEIYVWDSATELITNVSNNPNADLNPVWSEDGWLAWVEDFVDDYHLSWNINVLNTTTQQRYVIPAGRNSETIYPKWAVGGRLAWASQSEGNYEIYVWDRAINEVTNISRHPARDINPAWSNNGRLAWSSNRSGNSDIYIWDSSIGLIPSNISRNSANNIHPVWSPTGGLLWEATYAGNDDIEIFLVGEIGENPRVIGRNQNMNSQYLWSDEEWLVWLSDRTGKHELYLWDNATGASIPIRSNAEQNLEPAWSPMC